ncbi:2-keto-4-pentenoate hydratase [Paraburkholderia sp. SARCC-3016]|jgi:2-keto-4-pentenoate hydratase|uniref:2-keto-4-pentenoate hydratase n=1 Tax=Paraburkholderia sp. SARCC-3016 TaxID=3058611 RepID=UPI002808344E|nr:2-keto-4-pentenoate hydratase [Paraburkholderia sp. SARCC-3016]MDQ7978394.1 2-keto-4-pentenoate hydratase [Paraburkholderia sp. SARCC-3016]
MTAREPQLEAAVGSAHDSREALAALLVDAGTRRAWLDALPQDVQPANAEDAYAVQHATLDAMRDSIGGWKVGAKTPTGGPIQGSPLPAACVHRSGAGLPRGSFNQVGLELEVAFALGRRFEPAGGPYTDEQVLDAIESLHATIEIVTSRFGAWPDIDKLWQLADLQNHGALIVGEAVPYDGEFPFLAPSASFMIDGAPLFEGTPANPAGDPRRLLGWLVNHGVSRGLTFEPGTVLTCGSYTGMAFPEKNGVVRGVIDGLPPVQFTLV